MSKKDFVEKLKRTDDERLLAAIESVVQQATCDLETAIQEANEGELTHCRNYIKTAIDDLNTLLWHKLRE